MEQAAQDYPTEPPLANSQPSYPTESPLEGFSDAVPLTQTESRDIGARRVCAFLNRNSGERGAADFVKEQLIANFGESMVFDLFPTPGKPPAIDEAKAFLADRQPDLLVVAGGDGTVSLSMDITDELRDAGTIGPLVAPVAVLPMGTGNDLSRTLGFGSGYTKPLLNAEEKFKTYMDRLRKVVVKKIDRYTLDIYVVPRGEQQPIGISGRRRTSTTMNAVSDVEGVQQTHLRATEEVVENHSPLNTSDTGVRTDSMCSAPQESNGALPMFSTKFMNYFSVGFDAEVAANFSEFRDKHPSACSSRALNKMWYAWFGCVAMFETSTFSKERCSLIVNGEKIKIPSSSKAIIVSNVLTYSGGAVLWSDRRHRFGTPAVDDKMVEVTEMDGVWHMIGVGTKTRSAGKLGQGSQVVIRVPAHYVMQYDGEPIDTMGAKDRDAWMDIRHFRQSLGSCMPDGDTIVQEGEAGPAPLSAEEEG